MLCLKKQFQELIQKTIKLILSEYKPKTITRKLEEFYNLSFEEFSAELENQKAKITLKKKSELIEYFETEKKKLVELKFEIEKIDSEINQLVYKLYDLTDEEIQIIEKKRV